MWRWNVECGDAAHMAGVGRSLGRLHRDSPEGVAHREQPAPREQAREQARRTEWGAHVCGATTIGECVACRDTGRGKRQRADDEVRPICKSARLFASLRRTPSITSSLPGCSAVVCVSAAALLPPPATAVVASGRMVMCATGGSAAWNSTKSTLSPETPRRVAYAATSHEPCTVSCARIEYEVKRVYRV